MIVSEDLSHAFEGPFESWISQFAATEGLLPDPEALFNSRYLSRAIIPHVMKLSKLFNRDQKDQQSSLSPYWKESSNPAHLRLAYFLYFMPSNAFRMAAVWNELHRLGYQWPHKELKALEFGAGPGSGVCGIATGEHAASLGLPQTGTWALIEQDKAILELGKKWLEHYFSALGYPDWAIRPFHRKVDLSRELLPRTAPQFNLWIMSFYLNESSDSMQEWASKIIKAWNHHLEDEGLFIIVEPALKLQSRKLLELRKELLAHKKQMEGLQILLPCLGHQACGALSNPEDWCHEEVTWWRPSYFKLIDQMAGLDRKTLPFSYLVLTKSKKPLSEILKLKTKTHPHRLVSPAYAIGKSWEFYACGEDGKHRVRYTPKGAAKSEDAKELHRGDLVELGSPEFKVRRPKTT